jgi:hypothetical protein
MNLGADRHYPGDMVVTRSIINSKRSLQNETADISYLNSLSRRPVNVLLPEVGDNYFVAKGKKCRMPHAMQPFPFPRPTTADPSPKFPIIV